MRISYLSLWAIFIGTYACSSSTATTEGNIQLDAPTIKAEIQQLEKRLAASLTTTFDTSAALDIVNKTEALIESYPNDTLAAALLFRAADVARGAGEIERAIILWGRVNREYEEFEKAPEALFLQGFTADQDLRDSRQAIKYYQYFLQRHPEHFLVNDVQLLLSALENEESPDDLVRKFQERNED